MIALRFEFLACAALMFLGLPSLRAQGPDIGRNGVFNAASATPLVLAGDEIARGALVVVTGIRLGADAAGTSVRLAGPRGNTPLTVVSVTPTRIEARVPVAAPLGPASLTVTAGGKSSRAIPVRVVASQFGIFSRNGKGAGPGSIDNLSAAGGRSANSISQSATPGQSVVVTGTGLGNAAAPTVFIAGQRAALVSVRKASAAGNPDELVVRVPAETVEGCFVPVQVRNAGRFPSNMVTLAIHRGGGQCTPLEAVPFGAWAGSRFGFVAVARSVSRSLDATADSITDEAGGSFARLPQVNDLPPFFLPPPAGTCVSLVEAAGDNIPQINPVLDLLFSGASEGPLAAGADLAINDGQVQQKLRPVEGAPGVYYNKFTSRAPGGVARLLPHFLGPSQLNLSGGGRDVGPFRLRLPGPEPFTVTSPISLIDRARGATFHWDRLDADRLVIAVLVFTDPVSFTTGTCYCVAAPGATAITIPPEVLGNFPPVSPLYGGAQSFAILTSWPVHPVAFAAAGLEHALGISVFVRNWEVTLR